MGRHCSCRRPCSDPTYRAMRRASAASPHSCLTSSAQRAVEHQRRRSRRPRGRAARDAVAEDSRAAGKVRRMAILGCSAHRHCCQRWRMLTLRRLMTHSPRSRQALMRLKGCGLATLEARRRASTSGDGLDALCNSTCSRSAPLALLCRGKASAAIELGWRALDLCDRAFRRLGVTETPSAPRPRVEVAGTE